MKSGLEFAIKVLEKGAARHQYYASGNYLNAHRDVQFRHQCQAEACLGASKLLRRKLRSVIKESQPQPNNKPIMQFCPKCGSKVQISDRGYDCTNLSCSYGGRKADSTQKRALFLHRTMAKVCHARTGPSTKAMMRF